MRLAFLTHRLPYAPNRGDRSRAHYELRVLATRHEVHLVSLVHDADEESHAGDLASLAASVTVARVPRLSTRARALSTLPTARPLTHVLLDSPALRPALCRLVADHPPDLVLAYCSSMARFALEPPLAGLPFVLDMVDVDSEKWAALASGARQPKRWIYEREARCLRGFEARATARSEIAYVVNEREAANLLKVAGPDARVRVLPNGVDTVVLRPPAGPAASLDVVFCGVMNYGPNEQAALWLARKVWPAVLRAQPAARLLLVGAQPTRRLLDLPARDASVVVTGTVPDVRPYLWNAAVAVAPLRVARGVQTKVLEAVAAGLPTIVTPVVAEGLPREIMPACRSAENADDFAAAIVSALALQPRERRLIAESASIERLGWSRALAPLMDKMEELSATAATQA